MEVFNATNKTVQEVIIGIYNPDDKTYELILEIYKNEEEID